MLRNSKIAPPFLTFRTVAMMVVFSQYLKNVPLPVPVYTPKGGFRVVRAPVFKLFPVREAHRN